MYLDALEQEGYSINHRARVKSTISSFARWLMEEIGLSTVRSIAVSHGGTLRLSSIPEQGTTVTLTLPLAHGAVSAQRRCAGECCIAFRKGIVIS